MPNFRKKSIPGTTHGLKVSMKVKVLLAHCSTLQPLQFDMKKLTFMHHCQG